MPRSGWPGMSSAISLPARTMRKLGSGMRAPVVVRRLCVELLAAELLNETIRLWC